MFDPKAAGEEADKMINELNQPSAEDQAVDTTEAIVQDGPTSNDDQGAGTTDATLQQDDTSQKLEALTKQMQQAEQRWKVLQGMVDKKDSEIETLRSLLAQVSAPKADAEAPAAQPVNLLTADDASSFGEDLIDMTKRASLSVLQAEMPRIMKSIEDRLSKLEGSVQGVQQVAAKTSQDQFFDGLVSAVADWEAINVDEGFLAWLNETDQFTGATRMELLQHAFGKQDVARTAAFFLEFKRLYRSEPEPEQQSSKIAKLVAPGKAKNSAARVESAGKRVWTRAEIAKLYSDKRENRITQKAFDEFERDIFAAQNDGRIAA